MRPGPSLMIGREMAMYQCFFYSDGIIVFWENLESESNEEIADLLTRRLCSGKRNAAEAWLGDDLICRILVPANRNIDGGANTQTQTDNFEENASCQQQSGGRGSGDGQ